MSISRSNSVVESSEVRGSGDEVDVEVGVVVLLEVDGVESVASERGGSGKAGDDISDVLGLWRSEGEQQVSKAERRGEDRGENEPSSSFATGSLSRT